MGEADDEPDADEVLDEIEDEIFDDIAKGLGEERDALDDLEGVLRVRAWPGLNMDEDGDMVDASGMKWIPVWRIETDTLRVLNQAEFLDYVEAHPGWLSYRDANRQVRFRPEH
ncbi:MAG TPA: hypothetical protein VN886_13175 [Acidimicrobiales bacterium]|nr:hypothetical protein [Acidimicrobiales bacterium]